MIMYFYQLMLLGNWFICSVQYGCLISYIDFNAFIIENVSYYFVTKKAQGDLQTEFKTENQIAKFKNHN